MSGRRARIRRTAAPTTLRGPSSRSPSRSPTTHPSPARRSTRSRRSSTWCMAGSGAPRSSRRRHSSTPCSSREIRRASSWPSDRWKPWPVVVSVTKSEAASTATRSTPAGWFRTSRRCSTTTRSCSAPTCVVGDVPQTTTPASEPSSSAPPTGSSSSSNVR